MDHQHVLVIRAEAAETRKASTNIKRRAGTPSAKTVRVNEDYSKQNVIIQVPQQKSGTEKMGYIPILTMLTTGMILQLSGNSFCISAGLLICVSICALICISVLISAILYNERSISPHSFECSKAMDLANNESETCV